MFGFIFRGGSSVLGTRNILTPSLFEHKKRGIGVREGTGVWYSLVDLHLLILHFKELEAPLHSIVENYGQELHMRADMRLGVPLFRIILESPACKILSSMT